VHAQAVEDVRDAGAGEPRREVAAAWARAIAAADPSETVGTMFGMDAPAAGDVATRCLSRRARNVLRSSGLSRIEWLMNATLADLRRLPDCNRTVVVDILTAALLTLVDDPHTLAGDVPLPGLGMELDGGAVPGRASVDGNGYVVSDPLLDLLKSR
jgi:hypothetical protein